MALTTASGIPCCPGEVVERVPDPVDRHRPVDPGHHLHLSPDVVELVVTDRPRPRPRREQGVCRDLVPCRMQQVVKTTELFLIRWRTPPHIWVTACRPWFCTAQQNAGRRALPNAVGGFELDLVEIDKLRTAIRPTGARACSGRIKLPAGHETERLNSGGNRQCGVCRDDWRC